MYPLAAEASLMIDFVNLNIKSTRSFKGGHRNKICMCVYINDYSFILCF
jgi:hypothetical protein